MIFRRTAPGRRGSPGALAVSWLLAVSILAAADVRAATYSVPRFSDTAVVTGLMGPTDFVFLPDGRLLILEKQGRVILAGGGLAQNVVALDIISTVDDFFEQGLLGVCLHPSFDSTGYIYLYYSRNAESPFPRRNRISRFTLVGNTISPGSEVVILDHISAAGGNHNGGTVAIGPDGKLYAAPGDAATASNAQSLAAGNFSGKVLRMELDGSPAAGNPSLGPGTEPRIFAWGFRNPFRFSFRANGALYVGDVGSSGTQLREELNVVVAGGDYGWPDAEGSVIVNPPCTGCIPPIFEYTSAVGRTIIGGVFATGSAYPPPLQGKYVFGDNSSNWIRYLEIDGSNTVVGGLQDFATAAEGPVAFHQGPDGHVYYAAINSGRIYRIDYGRDFHTVAPCRVVDTRGKAGPWGGPRLDAGAERTFVIAGRCGIPATARAVSVNLTVTEPSDFGHITAYPAGGAALTSSVINFRPGLTRANNAILVLGTGGGLAVRAAMASGGVHFLIDVTGYSE